MNLSSLDDDTESTKPQRSMQDMNELGILKAKEF